MFAGYRLTRFVGWDEWPPIAKLRAWAIGERWVATDPLRALAEDPGWASAAVEPGKPERLSELARGDGDELELPGKQPSSHVSDVRPAYDRPLLAHLIHCPFCLGWWISLGMYGAWLAAPRGTMYAMAPFAISGLVGLVAKNLDP